MTPKEVVKRYYNSDLATISRELDTHFHKDCSLHWNSSKGFQILNYDDIESFFENVSKSYISIRTEISHLLQEDRFITTRYTTFARTIENEYEEIPLAHYISIWEIKDGKLFKGFEISQLADDNAIRLNSFSEIKI